VCNADHDEDFGPTPPDTAQGGPEQPVQRIQPGPRLFPLEHSDLLPEGEDFQRGVTPTPEEYPGCRQEGYDEFEHVLHLVPLCAQDSIGRGR
jgi:hypothetical protein